MTVKIIIMTDNNSNVLITRPPFGSPGLQRSPLTGKSNRQIRTPFRSAAPYRCIQIFWLRITNEPFIVKKSGSLRKLRHKKRTPACCRSSNCYLLSKRLDLCFTSCHDLTKMMDMIQIRPVSDLHVVFINVTADLSQLLAIAVCDLDHAAVRNLKKRLI